MVTTNTNGSVVEERTKPKKRRRRLNSRLSRLLAASLEAHAVARDVTLEGEDSGHCSDAESRRGAKRDASATRRCTKKRRKQDSAPAAHSDAAAVDEHGAPHPPILTKVSPEDTPQHQCTSAADIAALPPAVGLDCEFVGVGPRGSISRLGRCSVVDAEGGVLLDVLVRPDEPVTDYRTRWSGLRARDLLTALPPHEAIRLVRRALRGRLVVGHALHNDFAVLGLDAGRYTLRDTSTCRQLRALCPDGRYSLKAMTRSVLGVDVQQGEHCSVEDACAALRLYQRVAPQWEATIAARRTGAGRQKRQRDPSSSSDSSATDSADFLADEFWTAVQHV